VPNCSSNPSLVVHLGPFALTGLLLACLLPVEGSRVVTISSQGHRVKSHN
jgi:hypothetical protein